jgi:type I restriction enzyme M protein
MVALPGQLFTNTQIPACIWFLTRTKAARNGWRGRKGETLFMDARKLGYMKDRVLRDFAPEDIQRIAGTFHAWKRSSPSSVLAGEGRGEGKYEDIPGFSKAVKLDEIKKHDYVLTPGRYIGAAEQEHDGEPFEEKMARLTVQLREQFTESARLEAAIRENLARLGYGG